VAAAARNHVAKTDGEPGSNAFAEVERCGAVDGIGCGGVIGLIAEVELRAGRNHGGGAYAIAVVDGEAGADVESAMEGKPVETCGGVAEFDIAGDGLAIQVEGAVVGEKSTPDTQIEVLG